MTAMHTKYSFPPTRNKNEGARRWLQRAFRRPAVRQAESSEGDGWLRRRMSLKRPQTAPNPSTAPTVPSSSIHVERISTCFRGQPPPRPPRPDADVMRDINAWLDTSTSMPSPPLMSGLPYWRAGTAVCPGESVDFQYAVPIVRKPDAEKLSTSPSQQMKSLCHGAKMMQVRMPSLLRSLSQHTAVRKQMKRRSSSMPLLAIAYTETQQAAPPMVLTRSRSSRPPARRPTSKASTEMRELLSAGQNSLEHLPVRHGSRASARFGQTESNTERRINAVLGHAARSGNSTRPSTAGAHASGEDSMCDLSDAPTYSSGPPPPSYRSHAASMLSTSSFGCVDGMNPAQRQISQQQAAHRHGVRRKLKKFARAHFTTCTREREV
ncbi:hypothetical protein P153DRAFT_391130 [Dothidotthia symphoricarpi CBS 119687]|uniref:Uncharacterized protein n=1 Tax=Dothidotthia symphoricarpi CBS 119687 TaxID=1392245 RepID=A0A6A5ZYX6_9PLEO|nr:uncharacterized protein P153DRAFT_391130 [Dothidotthia symphoricarpi CBS 119687]KAF2124094.1 hypothetical protein P153DRAFT_391130 [Dothidotthia symphoricarpi CBS 119687]